MARGIRLERRRGWDTSAAHTACSRRCARDGVPISLPVWFVVLDRTIYVSGPAHTKKFARIARDPRVSFLVESGERWVDLRRCPPHRNGADRRRRRSSSNACAEALVRQVRPVPHAPRPDARRDARELRDRRRRRSRSHPTTASCRGRTPACSRRIRRDAGGSRHEERRGRDRDRAQRVGAAPRCTRTCRSGHRSARPTPAGARTPAPRSCTGTPSTLRARSVSRTPTLYGGRPRRDGRLRARLPLVSGRRSRHGRRRGSGTAWRCAPITVSSWARSTSPPSTSCCGIPSGDRLAPLVPLDGLRGDPQLAPVRRRRARSLLRGRAGADGRRVRRRVDAHDRGARARRAAARARARRRSSSGAARPSGPSRASRPSICTCARSPSTSTSSGWWCRTASPIRRRSRSSRAPRSSAGAASGSASATRLPRSPTVQRRARRTRGGVGRRRGPARSVRRRSAHRAHGRRPVVIHGTEVEEA